MCAGLLTLLFGPVKKCLTDWFQVCAASAATKSANISLRIFWASIWWSVDVGYSLCVEPLILLWGPNVKHTTDSVQVCASWIAAKLVCSKVAWAFTGADPCHNTSAEAGALSLSRQSSQVNHSPQPGFAHSKVSDSPAVLHLHAQAGSSGLLQSAQHAERVASAAGASSSGRPAQPGIKLPSDGVPCSKAGLPSAERATQWTRPAAPLAADAAVPEDCPFSNDQER